MLFKIDNAKFWHAWLTTPSLHAHASTTTKIPIWILLCSVQSIWISRHLKFVIARAQSVYPSDSQSVRGSPGHGGAVIRALWNIQLNNSAIFLEFPILEFLCQKSCMLAKFQEFNNFRVFHCFLSNSHLLKRLVTEGRMAEGERGRGLAAKRAWRSSKSDFSSFVVTISVLALLFVCWLND